MENLDILFEAFELYRNKTSTDGDVPRFKKFYSSFKGEKYEDIALTFSTCTIETDWVEAIEKGIPFIEKAIKEERQFIRNDGEVLPIEKIRKVSKDSIQDLAKHSNYITHEPEDGSDLLIPDKMLMIRKESDYAIYENRVLYATLVYLRDFVSSRLNKIKELTNRYEADMHANKHIDLGNRKLEYNLHIYETRNNDPIVSKKNSAGDIIKRLDDVMANIIGLLKRPLMVEVAKAELVSRPITKTNILRMNHNFRESLACFDYIANYNSPGYTIKTSTKHFNPYSTEMMDAYGEVAILLSFLTYMYGNDLSNDLRKTYRENIEKRKIEDEEKVLAKLKSLKVKAKENEKTLAEYFILFENGYRVLEKRFENIDREIKELTIKHKDELKSTKADYENQLSNQREYYEGELIKLEAEHKEEIDTIISKNAAEIEDIKEKARLEAEKILLEGKERLQELTNKINEEKDIFYKDAKEKMDTLEASNKEYEKANKKLTKKVAELEARIHALLIKNFEAPDPETIITEESFDELQKTKEIFDAYYKDAWAAAKKAIREENLTYKKKGNKKK